MALSEEIELKLAIAPEALAAVLKSPALAGRGVRFRPARKLVTTYYDTKKGALKAKGIFLRVRQDGARFTQAVKTAGDGAVLARRGEWEWRIPSAEPDLVLAAETGLKPLAKRTRKGGLRRLFASDMARRLATLTIGETVLELALDEGVVRAGRRVQPLLELEIEVKAGPVGPLFALARDIGALPGVSVGFATKASRGFALAAGKPGGAVKASDLGLTADLTESAAAAAILDACAGHAAANLPAVTAQRLPEGVHQLRVALRRLRAALSIFKAVLPDERRKKLRKSAGKLASALGLARELDVLLSSLAEVSAPAGLAADLQALKRRLVAARRAAWAEAVAATADPATTVMLVDLAETAHELRDTPALAGTPPLAAVAMAELETRFEAVLAAGPDLEALSIEARHDLRLALKKLRYGADFFAALFPRKAVKPGMKVLAALQEALGAFNDAATVEPLLAKMIADAPEKASAGLQRAAAFVTGWAAHRGAAAWNKARLCWADFTEKGAFWR